MTEHTPREDAEIAQKAAEIPVRFRPLYLRAIHGKSRRDAMEAFCAECLGWSSEACGETSCPLHRFRRVHK
jgi:hypothetical protein